MLTRERMERMIDAKDSGEAAKVLSECGYGELTQLTSAALEELLADARRNTFRDMADSVPDRRLVEVFQLKYDYHNAKVLIKAQAMGLDEARLLSQGGRYDPQRLREDFLRDDLRDWGEVFRQAVLRAREVLAASRRSSAGRPGAGPGLLSGDGEPGTGMRQRFPAGLCPPVGGRR